MSARFTERGSCELRRRYPAQSLARRWSGNSLLTLGEFIKLARLWGFRCAYCRRAMKRLIVEHVEPLSRGGQDSWENLVPACHPCNTAKGDSFLLEWLLTDKVPKALKVKPGAILE